MENSVENTKKESTFVKLIWNNKFFLMFIVIIILVRFFVISVSEVVNVSMQPTLLEGDVVVIDQKFFKLTGIDRFDIVIFKYDGLGNEEKMLIKRVVGMPGETIEINDGELYINDQILECDLEIATINKNTPNMEKQTIPQDSYFVLGDNRVSSVDSRRFGSVEFDDIEGKAMFRMRPISRFRFLALEWNKQYLRK